MTHQLLIGGVLCDASDGGTFDIIEPATGQPFATVAKATISDADRAVMIAHRSFDDGRGEWARTSATDRGRVLYKVAELLRDRANEIAAIEARNAGKPFGGALWEVNACANTFEFFAGAANKHHGKVIPISKPGLDVIVHSPIGVCALIVPWNFPLMIAGWKVAPALACGNSIVLKPASLTPLSALILGGILIEAGVPKDCVTVLPGPGGSVGGALVANPRVDKISLTGDSSTGSTILRQSADNIARVSLELGGKSATIVFADSDVDLAAASAPGSVFDNAGQDCCARARMIVERSVYDRFIEGFVNATTALTVGDPFADSTDMGPMISAGQRQISLDYLALGREAGGRVLCGGETSAELASTGGYYLSPAVVADVDNSWRIAQEEIFGPVACVIPFDTEEDAIRIANDSPYGLSGSLWTGNTQRAIRVSKRMRTGVIGVNTNSSVHIEASFGGFKKSGLGRELGMGAMDHYTESKNIYFAE